MWTRNCCNYSKLILVYSLLLTSSAYFCGIDQITKVPASPQNMTARHLQSSYPRESGWSPIRIEVVFLDYDSTVHQSIKLAVEHSIQWFRNVLTIKRLTSNLKIDDTFQEIEGMPLVIPDKYYTEGVVADYLFFISIVSDPSSLYAGWATHLQNDANTEQPIIGAFFINYVEEYEYSYDDILLIAIHEMTHALVFDPYLFQYFVDSSGDLYEEVIKYDTARGAEVYKVTTPNVLKYARATFGCSYLDGVELETVGGLATVLSHWDKRIMHGDYMGPDIGVEDFVLSDITLGLFEDSGWYIPNYEYTQEITWGYQQGCSFLEEKCIKYQQPTNVVFCAEDTGPQCDYNRLNKGSCSMLNYDWLPEEFSYFKDSTLGGSDPYLDCCPVVTPARGGNCRGLDVVETELNSDYGEEACENCRCVEGTYSKNYEAHDHIGCHWIECEDYHTIVHIGDEEVECPEDGGTVVVPNYKGELYCPKWIDVCNPVPCMNVCSGIGICRYGVCECPDGTMGGDCSNIIKDLSYRDPITPREEDSGYLNPTDEGSGNDDSTDEGSGNDDSTGEDYDYDDSTGEDYDYDDSTGEDSVYIDSTDEDSGYIINISITILLLILS